jgi:hypothetical protein
MADGSGGGGAGLGVIVGALVVVVAIIGVVALGGGNFGQSKQMDVNIHTPNISAPSAPSPSK